MELDIYYQAMPERCNLPLRSRHEPNFGANLEFLASYAVKTQKNLDALTKDQCLVDFVYELRQALKRYPELEHQNLFLGRRWDMLYYLLSARRRRSEARNWSHWVEKVLFGGEMLNEETQTTIGFPIRYLNSAEVSKVSHNLKATTAAMLYAHWNPQRMSESNVYKLHPNKGEDYFKWIKEDFEQLKRFYASTQARGEGVLTFVS